MNKTAFIKAHGSYPHRVCYPFRVIVEAANGVLYMTELTMNGADVGESADHMITVDTFRGWLRDLPEQALRKLKNPSCPDIDDLVVMELKRRHLAVPDKNKRSAARYVEQNVKRAGQVAGARTKARV
jgi:hypothetical protein